MSGRRYPVASRRIDPNTQRIAFGTPGYPLSATPGGVWRVGEEVELPTPLCGFIRVHRDDLDDLAAYLVELAHEVSMIVPDSLPAKDGRASRG